MLDELVEKNVYPIVFIGSGISKRYLKQFPNWNDLIKRLWSKAYLLEDDNEYYRFMNNLRSKIIENDSSLNDKEVDYKLNIIASSEIEKKFNQVFIEGKITVKDYGAREYYEQRISPFKKEIASIFEEYEILPDMEDEVRSLQKFLSKTKIILTTNYDSLIEDSIKSYSPDSKLDVFVGQKGFLKDTTGWSELYKVHGSVTEPHSIIISEEDYKLFDKNSVLISAKIIASLIDAPIIFLGYSLTDINIRKIISDFAGSINKEDMISGSERIILVERSEGENEIIETRTMDQDLGIDMTVLTTDNFESLFEKLSMIDEGLSSSFINRYQSLLRQLIVERGRDGVLQTLLISPVEMKELESNQQLRRNAAVVLADSSIVFAYPDVVSYFIDYFSEDPSINSEVALRYIASQTSTTRLPFYLYVNNINLDETGLPPHIKDKITARTAKYSELEKVTRSIHRYNRIAHDTLEDILKAEYVPKKEIDVVAYNIEKLDREQVKDYIIEKLTKIKEKNEYVINTEIRRLALCFDLLYIKV
ncbi:SIR2 family protein [Enterococcus hulanensis]|uniref:SIR2 family protein n=1 Tax=Enterococcus hulanensis TaxID=2559929 RepID=UPI0030F40712